MNKFKISFFIMLFCMSLTVSAQTNNVIILWDVTWSMKGLTGTNPVTGEAIIDSTKDIWEPTKNTIIETIEKLPINGSYNVNIIPFENPSAPTGFPHEIKDIRSLDRIEQQDLIDWVRKYEGSPFHLRKNTNICQALENVFNSIAQQDDAVNNQIILLCDGRQNTHFQGSTKDKCFDEQLRKFCMTYCNYQNQQESDRLYLYKLKLVNSNVECPCIINDTVLDSECVFTKKLFLDPVSFSETVSYSEIIKSPDLNIKFNILGSDLPDDFRLEVASSDPEIKIISTNFENYNLNLRFNLDQLNLDAGSERSTTFSFIGHTNEKCYSFNIKPFKFTVVRNKISTVIIGDAEPIKK